MAAGKPAQSADFEDVGEVTGQREAHRELGGVRVVVLDPVPLVQPPGHHPDAPDVQRLLGHRNRTVLEQFGVGQVDVGHVGPFGRRGQEDRVPAGQLHLEVRQEPGVLVIQAVAPLPAVVQVSGHVRVEEGIPFLDREDVAGEVGQQRRDGLRGGSGQRFGLCRSFRVHASARLDARGKAADRLGRRGPPTGAVYVPVAMSSMTFVIRWERVESF